MASNKNNQIISEASPHTIKKFELVARYIKAWAQKLMNNNYCDGLIYIDCMCNSGMYVDSDEVPVKGTALRVAEILRDVAWNYPHKQVRIYFNDMDTKK